MRHASRLIAKQIAGFCVVFGGCLPLEKAPAGSHVVVDRTLSGVFLVPSEEMGRPSHLLATGATRAPDRTQDTMSPSRLRLADVYALSQLEGQWPIEELSREIPVVRDLVLFDGDATTYKFASDHRGRLIFVQQISAGGWTKVQRFDLATRGMEEVGGNGWVDRPSFVLSQGRTRVFGGAVGEDRVLGDSGYELIDPVDSGAQPTDPPAIFVGEDLYYVTKNAAMVAGALGTSAKRSRVGAKPEMLASSSGKLSLTPILGDQPPQMLLSLVADRSSNSFALLDTTTLETTGLPSERGKARFESASSNGHWLLFTEAGAALDGAVARASRYFLYDWVGRAADTVSDTDLGVASDWRPGSEQLWFFMPGSSGFGIWTAGASWVPVTERGTLSTFEWSDGRSSAFTRDGRSVLLVKYSIKNQLGLSTYSIGLADDLTAPQTVLNSDGNELKSLWEIADGRVLAGVGSHDQIVSDRQDLLLVDPATGSSRLVGSGGHVVAVGKTRVLALLGWESSRAAGGLVLIDLTTGQRTVLAESVYAVAVDPGYSADVADEADRLAPGTRIAYLVRERLESPYDGLWLASLP